MKIGFPAAGDCNELKLFLSKDFVESGLMGMYDTQTGNVEVVSKDVMDKGLIDWVREHHIFAIITPEIKTMALKVFKEEGVNVYKAEGSMLTLNVDLLYNRALSAFAMGETMNENATSCSPSSCSSCSSTSCK